MFKLVSSALTKPQQYFSYIILSAGLPSRHAPHRSQLHPCDLGSQSGASSQMLSRQG